MEKRDVLNKDGVKIGELELPDGTSESIWEAKLLEYSNPVVFIPDVSPRQIRQAIILSGMTLEQVDAILDAQPEPQKSLAKIAWQYSMSFSRNDVLVDAIAAAIGITSEQTDALWKLAGSL